MTTTIIQSLRTWLSAYTGLKTGAPLWVDFLGPNPTQYTIDPIPGERITEWYIDNSGSMREFPFSFASMESTAAEIDRMNNIGFYEAFADWLEAQWINGNMPDLGAGKTPFKIEATGWGCLFEQGQSETGIYVIQCKLTYSQP